jgi:hypothetical protein
MECVAHVRREVVAAEQVITYAVTRRQAAQTGADDDKKQNSAMTERRQGGAIMQPSKRESKSTSPSAISENSRIQSCVRKRDPHAEIQLIYGSRGSLIEARQPYDGRLAPAFPNLS